MRFPGDLVGAYGPLLQLPSLLCATTVTECRLFEIPVRRALEIFRINAEAARFLAQRQTLDAARITSLLVEARTLTAEQRLFRLLSQLALMAGAPRSSKRRVSVRVPLAESEIADLIAINGSAFSRLKRALIRNGDLQQDKNVFSFAQCLAAADFST